MDLSSSIRQSKSAPPGSFYRSDSDSTLSRKSSYSIASIRSSPQDKEEKSWRKVFYFIFAHAPEFTILTSSCSDYSRVLYIFLFVLESGLRSVGDVAFCGNPFSGLLILIASAISSPHVVILSVINLAAGILTSVIILKVPLEEVRGGGVLFNNYLLGTVIGLLAHENVLETSAHIVLTCLLTGILTPFIWRGLNGFLASQVNFPLLNSPFHIAILLYMYSGVADLYKLEESSVGLDREVEVGIQNQTLVDSLQLNATAFMNNSSMDPLQWEKVISGIVLAPSQVFGTNTIMTSLMVYFAIFVFSPILFIQSLTGSAIGTIAGAFLCNKAQFDTVYNGSWGYNPLFTSAALGGFFVIFSTRTWILSVAGSILTVLLYSAMLKVGFPPLGLPFMLITWLLLPNVFFVKNQTDKSDKDKSISEKPGSFRNGNNGEPFLRLCLSDITTPEWNIKLLQENQNSSYESHDSNDSIIKYSQPPQTTPTLLIPQHNSVLPL